MPEFDSRSWKKPFLEMLIETDKEKLTKLVHATEGAMFLREQELAGSANHHNERLELNTACEVLMSIQINKLGWPCSLPNVAGPRLPHD